MKPRRLPLFRTLVLLAASHQAAFSETLYWDGSLTGTTALWSTVSAWSTDTSGTADPVAVPGAADIATFSADTATGTQTILLNGTQSAEGLAFASNLGHVFTSNNTTARTLNLGTSGITIADTAGNVTLGGTNGLNIALSGQQEWNVGAGRTLTVNNVISGANLFIKTGTGTLTLNGASTHTGGFTLSAGTLNLNNAGALGSATGTFTIAGGALQNASTTTPLTTSGAKPISLTGNFSYNVPGNGNGNLTLGSGNVTLAPASGSSITVTSSSGLLAFNGPVGGSGIGLIKNGAGTLALMGNNTYTGQTELGVSANLRVNGPAGIANTNVFLNGGLIELGGPVVENNVIELGTDPGQVRFKSDGTTTETTAHGGFGSASGYRKISITSEGVPNAPLVWGVTPHFMSAPAWGGSNGIFLLNTPVSSGTIELTNDLDFGGLDRRFSVRDGSAPDAPDAILSGKLTNGSLSLQTSGTLFITNPENSLSGTTFVTNGGALRVPAIAGYLGTSKVVLDRGMLELSTSSPVALGDGPGLVSFGAGGGGFSVYGGSRTVSIGSAETPLVWGSDEFLTSGTAELYLGGSASEGTTTFANSIDLGSSLRNIVVQNGSGTIDASLTGVLSGSGGGVNLVSGSSGTLRLENPANSYSGPTQMTGGAIVAEILADGGVNSNIGASSSAASNLVFTGGGLRYIGSGSTTDRLFDLKQSATINSAGFGPLVFSNTGANSFTSSSGSATTRTLSLTGTSPGVNEIRGGISDSTVATNNLTALSKQGTGVWQLSGNNTHTGTTTVHAGELILDFSAGNTPIGTGNITIDNSTLTLHGQAEGATAATLGTVRLGNGNNGASHILKLDAPSGSSGMSLTFGALAGNGTSSLNANLIDLSSHAGNSITINALNNGLTAVDNVIFANTNGNPPTGGRSTLIVKDHLGYGFAALNGPVPSTLTKLTSAATTALDESNTGSTTHFHLSYEDLGAEPGEHTLTRTAALIYSTLSIDATGGPVHLDLGASGFGETAANNGRGILVTGGNDVRLSSTGTTFYSPFFYHYGAGTLSLDFPLPNGLSIIAGGTGLIDYVGAPGGADARFYIDGCIYRFSNPADLSALTGGGIWVGNDGIVEVGNDLNGAAAGDFSNAIGNGGGQVRLTGDSGFSAFGGNRTVNIGGNTAPLTWGSNYFLTNGGNTDIDLSFRLSSPRADSTIEFANPISLGGRDRVIDVADGAADVDAILSGELSGLSVGVLKRGAGALVLSAANSYTGVTSVETGILRLIQPGLADTSTVRVSASAGAKLDLAHGQTDTVAALIVNGSPIANGIYGAAQLPAALSGTGRLNVGGVPETGTPYDTWVTANNLPGDKDEPGQDADDDGIKNVLEYAVGSNPVQPGGAVLSKASGTTGAISFNRATGRTDITAILERSPDLSSGSWTTIATSTGGAAYVSSDPTNVTVTETSVSTGIMGVTVADASAPVPTRVFYRVRVTRP